MNQVKMKTLIASIDAHPEGFSVADDEVEGRPLAYVNQGFVKMTGYSREEVIGQNCKFLQGERTNPAAVGLIRRFITERQSGSAVLLNYRKDGTPFWNRLSLYPIVSDGHQYIVGIQSDITKLMSSATELDLISDGIGIGPDRMHQVRNLLRFFEDGVGNVLNAIQLFRDEVEETGTLSAASLEQFDRLIRDRLLPLGMAQASSDLKRFDYEATRGGNKPRPMRVLIVDDNDVNRMILKRIVENEGHEGIEASNGQLALTAIQEDDFDLVFMDLQMPVMNGFEATRAISALKPGLPIVAVTAHTERESREHALQSGMREMICKPYGPEQILSALSTFGVQSN